MSNTAKKSWATLEPHQGDWMRKALELADMPAKNMAEYLDVDVATVSRWLNGKRPVKRQTLILWALRTGAPIEYLETGIIPTIPNLPPKDYNAVSSDNVTHVDFTTRKSHKAG